MPATKYEIENKREFANKLKSLSQQVNDLSKVFQQLSDEFFKAQGAIFKLKPGKYKPLKEVTRRQKERAGVGAYPILLGIPPSRVSQL